MLLRKSLAALMLCIAVLFSVACMDPVFAQVPSLVDLSSPTVNKTSSARSNPYNKSMWEANKKVLYDSTMSHYMRLLNMAETALQNSIATANLQNQNATFTSHIANIRTLNAGLLAGTNVGASQGRQLLSGDVSMNRQAVGADVVQNAINAEIPRLTAAITPVIVDAVRGLLSTVVESARNPQPGSQTTGRPPVNQSGG